MGWSKWSCQFFFLQLLILLPLSLELEEPLLGEYSSCQCPNYQPSYSNLAVDQCHQLIQASVLRDPEKVLAELRARMKNELIADLGAAFQSTLQQYLRKLVGYSLPENGNTIFGFPEGHTPPTMATNDNNDSPSESPNSKPALTHTYYGSHLD